MTTREIKRQLAVYIFVALVFFLWGLKVNWWDSRSDKPVPRRDVIAEVARMGAGEMAGFLVRTHMGR